MPMRLNEPEQALTGKRMEPSLIDAARKNVVKEIRPIDDIRSTARYRAVVAGNLVAEFLETLAAAGADAGAKGSIAGTGCRRRKLFARFCLVAAPEPGLHAWPRSGRSRMKSRCWQRQIRSGEALVKRIGARPSGDIRESARHTRKERPRRNLQPGPHKNSRRLQRAMRP